MRQRRAGAARLMAICAALQLLLAGDPLAQGTSPPAADLVADPATLVQMAWQARDAGALAQALRLLDQAAAALPGDPATTRRDRAFLLGERAALLRLDGQTAAAVEAAGAALALLEGIPGANAIAAAALIHRGMAQRDLWQGAAARADLGRAADIAAAAGLAETQRLALGLLAELALTEGQNAQAEALAGRALAAGGPAAPAVQAPLVFVQAQAHLARRRPADAETALAALPDTLPGDLAQERDLLAGRIALQSGQAAAAEALLAPLAEGTDTPPRLRASALYNLAELQFVLGRYAEAETMNQRAELAYRRALGPDHPVMGQVRHRLGVILQQIGDPAGALGHYEAALDILQARLGATHPLAAATRAEKARSLSLLGRHPEAIALLTAALAETEADAGQDAATVLMRAALGLTLREAGDTPGAIRELQAVQALRAQATFSPVDEPPGLAALAELLLDAGDIAGAGAAAGRALDILATLPGSGVDTLGEARRIRAEVALAAGDLPLALRLSGENLETAAAQMAELARTTAYATDFAPRALRRQIAQALDLRWSQATTDPAAAETMFRAAQILHLNEVTRAANGVLAAVTAPDASPATAGHTELAAALAQRQAIVAEIRALSARAAIDGALPEAALARLVGLQADRDRLDRTLIATAPAVQRLLMPQVLSVADTAALLAPDEALWLHAVTDRHSYLFLVTVDGLRVRRSDLDAGRLDDLVRRARATLDQGQAGGLQPFDSAAAMALHTGLIAPFGAAADRAARLVMIPDGAAQQISLAVLMRDAAPADVPGPAPRTPEGADARFLGLTHALVLAPSVSSFAALRALGPPRPGRAGFTGFGDPVLEGPGDGDATGGDLRGGLIDRHTRMVRAGVLSRLFEPLPETADELRAMSGVLPEEARRLFLGPDASETRVKSLPPRQGDTLVFATHAVVAGDFDHLSEPALVLSPPIHPTQADDGLLTAGEIARLRLAADMVILSACNTGSASGRSGAPGLSGLASGFFAGGARSVVVSHWTILSVSSVLLMPPFFAAAAGDEATPPSEALRRAMVAVASRTEHEGFAHPAVWGPFSVVGGW